MISKKIFDYDIPCSWKRIPKCSVCLSELTIFRFKSSSQQTSLETNATLHMRPPLKSSILRAHFLKCYHPVCNKCFFPNNNQSNVLKCKICQTVTHTDRRFAPLQLEQNSEPHFFLRGFISYIDGSLAYEVQRSKPLLNQIICHSKKNTCAECDKSLTDYMCCQCNIAYCVPCFQKVHKFGKAIQKHSLTLLESDSRLSTEKDVKRCLQHKKYVCDMYCVNCSTTICKFCSYESHDEHHVIAILDKNKDDIHKLHHVLEAVKKAKDLNRDTQKGIKSFEKSFEDNAVTVIEEMSTYFLSLHAYLQDLERTMLIKIKNKSLPNLMKFSNVLRIINKKHEVLDELLKTLTEYSTNLPQNMLLSTIIERANRILETSACTTPEIDYEEKSPFKWNILKDFKEEIKSCFQLICNEFDVNSKIQLNMSRAANNIIQQEDDNRNMIQQEEENTEQIIKQRTNDKSDQSTIMTKRPKKKFNKNNRKLTKQQKNDKSLSRNPPVILKNTKRKAFAIVTNSDLDSTNDLEEMNSSCKNSSKSMEDTRSLVIENSFSLSERSSTEQSFQSSFSVHTQKVSISYIKDPQHFYVRNQAFLSNLENFQKSLVEESTYAGTPSYIEMNEVYLVLNHVENIWCRGKILDCVKPNVYSVYLIDFGDILEIPKQRIRELSSDLSSQPYGAILCSLYAIQPNEGKWSSEATNIMSELTRKNLVTMIVLKSNVDVNLVDIIAPLTYATSVRDVLLFIDLAEPVALKDAEMLNRMATVEEIKEKMILSSTKSTFFKNMFHEDEYFRVAVLNVVNPQEFYAIKLAHKEIIDKMNDKLNEEYKGTSQPKIYFPRENMPCVVYIRDAWHRARVVGDLKSGFCKVWLVDKGRWETVYWKQLRVIQENFLMSTELAFECSLADIEPLQENDYSWTSESIAELQRIVKNPDLRIFIKQRRAFRYKVVLYVNKIKVEMNVNALMVKNGHANSTGVESTCLEYQKVRDLMNYDELSKDETESLITQVSDAAKKSTNSRLKTMKAELKITHLVSPGEFYIQLIKHANVIKELHRSIQNQQRERILKRRCGNEKYDNKSPNREKTECKNGPKTEESENEKSDKNLDATENLDWKVGDKCLILTALRKNDVQQWYRGLILAISQETGRIEICKKTYTVYLRDYGKKIENVTEGSLDIIDSNYARCSDAALKCHMACVKPSGGIDEWSYSSIEDMNRLIVKYEALGGTIQGEKNGNSIPVVLWGKKTECSNALAPTLIKWININRALVNSGLAHLVTQFNHALQTDYHIEDEYENNENWINNILQNEMANINKKAVKAEVASTTESEAGEEIENNNVVPKSCSDDTVVVTTEVNDSWIPAKLIDKSIFSAIPTYVDNDGIIYLHDSLQESYIEKVRETVNKIVKETTTMEAEKPYVTGQPCLARYHLDDLFYRAQITNLKNTDKIHVEFIDYGNEEICSVNDLRNLFVLKEIPKLACKYRLGDVRPTRNYMGGKKWSTEALDYIHSAVVGKLCTIRVHEDEENETIKKCSIRYQNYDLSELLIKENYAEKIANINFFGSNSDTSSEDNFRDKNLTDTIVDAEDYKRLFEKLEIENLYKGKFKDFNEDEENDPSDDEDCDNNLNRSIQSIGWKVPKNIDDERENPQPENAISTSSKSSSISSFHPDETSSVMSKEFSQPNGYIKYELPMDVTKFYCQATFMKDSTHLFVTPLIKDFQQKFQEMSDQIQQCIKRCPDLNDICINKPCLAIYEEDGLWYRAIIKSYSPDLDNIEVQYVDYLNTEFVSKKQIRKCPKKFLECPLRNIFVKLSGVKPNPRWRDIDIQRKLSELLQDKKVYVKVINHSSIPEVILYDSQSDENIIYKKLITDRFYFDA